VQSLPPNGTIEHLWLKPLVAMTALSLALALAVGFLVGMPTGDLMLTYVGVIWMFAPLTCVLVLAGAVASAVARKEPSPVTYIRSSLASRLGTSELAVAALVPIVATPLVFGAFGTIKQALPLAAPYSWDDAFSTVDRMLFLGVQPWRVTHVIFSAPLASWALEMSYRLWLLFLFVSVLGFALGAPRYVRARFFLAFSASWLLLGVGAAMLFSSAGPCFAEAVGVSSATEYAELMSRLRELQAGGYLVATLETQQQLWHAYSTPQYGFGMGISAMPSMHNAIAFLYVLALWSAGRAIRLLTCAFAACVFIGSIHLGWHYALDGVLAWAGTAAIWIAAGTYLRRCGYEAALRDGESAPAEPVPAVETIPA
jgi:hypothetical protein